jgi:hypothetical protein
VRDLVLGRVVVTVGVLDRVRDAPSQAVNQLRELGHRFQRARLAPAGDIRDRLARDVQANAGEHNEGDGFMPWVERVALCPGEGSTVWRVTAFWACYRRERVLVGMPAVEPEAKARGGPRWRVVGGRAAGDPPSLSAADHRVAG